MIGWLNIIGTMLEFALKKIAGKAIDVKMDDRLKIARRFLTLYYALSDLEVLTKEIILELKEAVESDDLAFQKEWTRCVFIAVDETTQRFLESTQGILEVIGIFDSPLAATLSDLEIGKFGLLNLASAGFKPTTENLDGIVYTYLPDEIANMDLEEYYKWYKKNYPLNPAKPEEWTDFATFGFVKEDEVQKDVLILREPESVNRLTAILVKQSEKITEARKLLKQFIEKQVTLDDLLAVRGSVKKLDMNHISERMSYASSIPFTRWITSRKIRKFEMEQEKD